MIPRSVCVFTRTRLADNNAKAKTAATLSVAYQQGFNDARTRLEQDAADPLNVGIWSWDGALDSPGRAGAASVRAIPETMARETMEDGARLARCLDGVEGQVWRDGSLVASRWWLTEPSDREWTHFLRVAKAIDGPAPIKTPAPTDVALRKDLPFVDRDPANLQIMFAPHRLAMALCGVIGFFAAIEIAQIVTHERAAAAIETRIEQAIVANESAVAARRQALAAKAQIEDLSTFGDPDGGMEAMLAILEALPGEKARLNNFRLRDEQIEARLTLEDASEMDISALIAELEENSALSEVFGERVKDNIVTVRAKIQIFPSTDEANAS